MRERAEASRGKRRRKVGVKIRKRSLGKCFIFCFSVTYFLSISDNARTYKGRHAWVVS